MKGEAVRTQILFSSSPQAEDRIEALIGIGIAHFNLGESEEAKVNLTKALELARQEDKKGLVRKAEQILKEHLDMIAR